MNEAIVKRNALLGQKVVEALTRRHFEAYYAGSREEALAKALELIPKNHSVGWGGSVSVDELGLKAALEERGYTLIDRSRAKNREESLEIMRQALVCGTFLMSANAITEDGELVNIDGNGNRLAALCFGPQNVLVIAGMNKVVRDLDAAWSRARNYAAPVNAQRFGLDTPCCKNGKCGDCLSEQTICAQFVRTRVSKPAGRIKVILVDEELGF